MDWIVFFIIILLLLVFDLGYFNKRDHAMKAKESIIYSLIYILFALAYGIYVWYSHGAEKGSEYFTGYIIEKVLALDNIFLISVIFSFLRIPNKYQHRVLFWGVVGVVILRGNLIYLGATMVKNFAWLMYIFGVILMATGVKMLTIGNKPFNIENNIILRLIKKYLPYTEKLDGNKFFTRQAVKGKSKIYITPLFVALILIEFCDLIFAIDSVPAIFSITTDIYIIYTSNIFAVLGLRALYFAILVVIEKFAYIKSSLSWILIFIGSKIFIKDILGLEKFPPIVSMSITFAILAFGIIYSLYRAKTPRGLII